MNGKLLFGLFALASSGSAFGQAATFYENNGVLVAPPAIPPNIDAVNFVNRGTFVINFTNVSFPITAPPAGLPPYETQNTVNYTNAAGHLMSANLGFRLETYDSNTHLRRRAGSFFNAGTINVGTIDTTNFLVGREAYFDSSNFFFLGTIAGAKLQVNATNIASPGTINMGFESLLSFKGRSIDLTRSTINSELQGFGVASGANLGFFFNQGIFDGYWGVGDVASQRPLFYPNGINPVAFFEIPPPLTPGHPVTNRNQQLIVQQLLFTNYLSYVSDTVDASGSNRFVRVVFIQNTNTDVQPNVYFPGLPDIAIEYTNRLGTDTNNLYVLDYFGVLTNFYVLPNGTAGNNGTFQPFNFFIFESPSFFFGPPAGAGPIPPGTFFNEAVTNQWSAYQALLQPLSLVLSDIAGQDVTNVPGRIEITADEFLNLNRARISGLNYISLKSTNHFGGSSRAQVAAPFMDINLRSTNGLLTITNLISPVIGRPEGSIELYSARWTNFVAGITNQYHVLFAQSEFSATSTPRIQDLVLRSTNTLGGGQDNIVIHDIFNVTRTFLLDSSRITIATNEPGAPNNTGGISLLNSSIVWPTSTPRLQYLTNNGFIQTLNTVFFGGSRTSPYYSSTFDEPYAVFVNSGGITNFGSLIWATEFQNSGAFFANGGDIRLQRAQNATLTNGAFVAPGGEISVSAANLVVSNHVLQAGAALVLAATNLLTDGYPLMNQNGQIITTNTPPNGGITNGNFWVATGFNLLSRPATGDLLATVVSNSAPELADIINRWAGEDRGCSPAGFANNVALGVLILDGGFDSQFTFTPAGGGARAIYVDRLELRDYSTNRDAAGNFIGINIEPNMHVYFADATANGVSIAEKMDGKNDGRLCWVRDYAGAFSSTNITYPDGTTYAFNSALAQSCNIDSDNDGIVNCNDLTPFFVSSTMALAVTINNTPAPMALVSWNTAPLSTNYLYSSPSPQAGTTNWQLVTNFVFGPSAGRVTVAEPMSPNGPRFYRVRVVPRQ